MARRRTRQTINIYIFYATIGYAPRNKGSDVPITVMEPGLKKLNRFNGKLYLKGKTNHILLNKVVSFFLSVAKDLTHH